MESFLDKVINDININTLDFMSTCFILPNRRSSSHFKKKLLEKTEKTTFAPLVYDIDSFIIQISGLNEAKLSKQILTLYESYIALKESKEIESFEEFSSWAPIFLKDVSEMDQNLLKVKSILFELLEINKINNWSEDKSYKEKKSLFWEILPSLYDFFKQELLKSDLGTKGICYKEAKENLEHYKEANNNLQHFFVGLNSLSKSEELIIKELLEYNNGDIYWDIDNDFLKNNSHGSSFFIKKYKNSWSRFNKKSFKWPGEDYNKKKNIQILSSPKLIGQAKIVGSVLSSIDCSKGSNTIVVLGEESIITPVLNYIPKNLRNINVTTKPSKELREIKNIILQIFEIQLSHKVSRELCFKELNFSWLIKKIVSKMEKLDLNKSDSAHLILKKWNNPKTALNNLIKFFQHIILSFEKNTNEFIQIKSALESLEKCLEIISDHSFVKDLKTLKAIIISQIEESLVKFKPNLNANIHIMGLLESRAIDFENVIITSLNEGILPKGKTQDSLIPFDLRKTHGLLTYGDRDAIYTYHFYRLIKRAKNIFLIYNNFSEGVLGGEKSRFIHQIEIEGNHNIVRKTYNPIIHQADKGHVLLKTPSVIKKLKLLAKNGYSPSALESYIKTPEEFYFKTLLNIRDTYDTDTINPRTIGLVFHDSLEAIYTPFIGEIILKKNIQSALSNIDNYVGRAFIKNLFKDYKTGKGLIAFEVVKNRVVTLLRNEIKDIELGNKIEIIALEKKMECKLRFEEIKVVVSLKGIIDRLDKRNGIIRIIDYKTGLIRPNEVFVKSIESCFGLTHLKCMQLLFYSLMFFKNNKTCKNVHAGLISFRDLNKGLMKFGIRQSSTEIDHNIDEIKLKEFEKKLKKLILEIMDPNIPFSSKV